jgi:hypothetical protein
MLILYKSIIGFNFMENSFDFMTQKYQNRVKRAGPKTPTLPYISINALKVLQKKKINNILQYNKHLKTTIYSNNKHKIYVA